MDNANRHVHLAVITGGLHITIQVILALMSYHGSCKAYRHERGTEHVKVRAVVIPAASRRQRKDTLCQPAIRAVQVVIRLRQQDNAIHVSRLHSLLPLGKMHRLCHRGRDKACALDFLS